MPPADQVDVERLINEYRVLAEVVRELKNPIPLPELLNLILEKIASVLTRAEFGAVMVWDQSSGLFRPWACYGCDAAILKRIGLQAGESITGKVYEEGKPFLRCSPDEVADAMENMRPGNRAIFARALNHEARPFCTVAVPIAVTGQKFGVLVCESFRGTNQVSAEDIPFLQSMADLIALGINRSRLEARADAIRQTREAERLRSEMMATLSHELRMPLTSIKGYSTMLLMDEVDWSRSQINDYLQLIDEECESMQAMITSILDSSLLDVNQLAIEPQPLHLQHIAHQVASEVQRQTSTHRLITDLSANLPLVNADPRWIKQVFRNILDNAVKYSPNGGLIVIHGEARSEDVMISIADQGIGISPEDMIPLFEKYFRVRSIHTRSIPGTGLGLPIARAIVEVHGGHIWAESKLGQGTTVYFSLPVAKSQADQLPGPAEQNGEAVLRSDDEN
jgi:K+-sensing histidine kinase KdpD